MTEQAPPEYLPFIGIQFNPAYYEQEIDNNITEYEANNTYLKKPINQNTGLINSVLTLTNTTTKEMQWTTPPTVITNYTNYDIVNKNLISNVSGIRTYPEEIAELSVNICKKYLSDKNSIVLCVVPCTTTRLTSCQSIALIKETKMEHNYY